MCEGCWQVYGGHSILNDKVKAGAGLVRLLYDTSYGSCGGHGHIVFDDWNIEDEHITSCLEQNQSDYSKLVYGDPMLLIEGYEICQRALLAFNEMTIEERNSCLALVKGCI